MRPKIALPGSHLTPAAPVTPARVPNYNMPGLDSPLEPHLKFVFQRRLADALALMDPLQPFPDDPLPDEIPRPGYAHAGVQAGPVKKLSAALRERQKATKAKDRQVRFEAHRTAAAAQRRQHLEQQAHRRAAIRVVHGGALDPALIEDRDYDLDEVVGADSRFNLRLISSFGG